MDQYAAIVVKLAGNAIVSILNVDITSQIDSALPSVSNDQLLAMERVDESDVDIRSDPHKRECKYAKPTILSEDAKSVEAKLEISVKTSRTG